MALVVQSGVAVGQVDLLSELETFVGTLAGWAVEDSRGPGGVPGGSEADLTLEHLASGLFVILVTDIAHTKRMRSRVLNSYASGSNFDSQAGEAYADEEWFSIQATDDDIAGQPNQTHNYWFFSDDNYIHGMVEVDGGADSGLFISFGFGVLDLLTGVNNGFFNFGSWLFNGDTRYHYDSGIVSNNVHTGSIIGVGPNATGVYGHLKDHGGTWRSIVTRHSDSNTTQALPSFASGHNGVALRFSDKHISHRIYTTDPVTIIPPMIKSAIYAPHSVTSGKYTPMGTIPGCRFIPMDSVGEAALVISGTEEWRCFPAQRTKRLGGSANLGQFAGIAYLESV